MTDTKPQLNALTGARGIAAWLVVLYHIRSGFTDAVPTFVIDVFAHGYLAVDLFFILSGFVMWLNYGAKFAAHGWRAAPDFLLRRIARIYPLHFAILLAMIVFATLLQITGRDSNAHYPVSELPLHFLLIQNWGFTHDLTWNDPAWSISTELGAYLMLPLAAVILVRRRWPLTLILAVIAGLSISLGLILDARGAATIGHGIAQNGLIRCLFEFLIGIGVCMIWQQAGVIQHRWLTIGSAVLIPVLAFGWGHRIAAIPAIFAACVYLLAQTSSRRSNPLNWRPIVYIGDISYSTYLVHFLAWIVFKMLVVSDPYDVPAALMMAFLLLNFVLSIALHALVEEPGRKWIQRVAARLSVLKSSGIERSVTSG